MQRNSARHRQAWAVRRGVPSSVRGSVDARGRRQRGTRRVALASIADLRAVDRDQGPSARWPFQDRGLHRVSRLLPAQSLASGRQSCAIATPIAACVVAPRYRQRQRTPARGNAVAGPGGTRNTPHAPSVRQPSDVPSLVLPACSLQPVRVLRGVRLPVSPSGERHHPSHDGCGVVRCHPTRCR